MRVDVPLAKAYLLLNHGPVTLVSSRAGERSNLMAASWAMPLDFDPPKVAVVIDRSTLTRELVDASREFALNIPSRALADATLGLGSISGRSRDKWADFRLTAMPADRIGVPFDRQRNEALRGVDRMNSLLLLLGENAERFTAAERESLCTEKNAEYVRIIERVTPQHLLPGARELLENLRASGIPVVVASSSKNARQVLERLGILPLLKAVVDGNDVAAAKPAPDLFLLAAQKLGIAPDACIVVEDAQAGVVAAHAGGMRCIGIGPLERVGKAECVVGSVAEINLPMLVSLNGR